MTDKSTTRRHEADARSCVTAGSRKHRGKAVVLLIAFLMTAIHAPASAVTPDLMAKLTAGDASAEDWFGYAVAVSGDTVVVGASQDDDAGPNSGSAYVFVRTASGWAQQAKLAPSDPQAYYNFGFSVAVDGDTVVVGTHLLQPAPPYTLVQGAYVFVRSGSGWTQQARLTSGITSYADWFGHSVSIDGDAVVVGSPLDRDNGIEAGAAHAFVRIGSTWTHHAKLTASDGGAPDRFGWSVAVDGDTAVIGAHLDDDMGIDAGAAYSFVRVADAWFEQGKLYAVDGAPFDNFGEAVALSGDVALVGASMDDDAGSMSGSAYIFRRLGGVWFPEAKLAAIDAAAVRFFGRAVSIDGDMAVVGADGSAYVYQFLGAGWMPVAKLTAATNGFGVSVSIDGAPAVVGAFLDPEKGTRAGAAFVFRLRPDDSDGDGILDGLDNCPLIANADQTDADADGTGDVCDDDDDNDGVLDGSDNCRLVANAGQGNSDGDSFGDACDGDIDGDGFENGADNCPLAANPDQTNTDHDAAGDECDDNDDNDTWPDATDNCPAVPNDDQADLDQDGIGDVCDNDLDGDGVINIDDNCPIDENPSQDDTDADGAGDVCDSDDDDDGRADGEDNCPLVPNVGQVDSDGDGQGDSCDGDIDGDAVANAGDNCPNVANSGQADFDADGIGDACDSDVDGDGTSNSDDACALTPSGGTTDADGCTIDQLCPCDGPSGTVMPWRNHGKYVSCVAQVANRMEAEGLIDGAQHDAIVSAAGRSACGGRL